MLYSITEDVQKKSSGRKYMEPGIHENVELVSVEYKQTDRGSELIAFNFVNSEDEQFAHTEWKTMPHKNIDTMSEKESDLYIRLVTSQLRKINKIATKFISEEAFRIVKGATFEEFCKNVVSAIGDANKGVKLRIKVIYDKRNFTALPSYTNYEWIELMTVPKEDSKIKILAKDKMEKDIPRNLEGANNKKNEIEESILEIDSATKADEKNEDNLPF